MTRYVKRIFHVNQNQIVNTNLEFPQPNLLTIGIRIRATMTYYLILTKIVYHNILYIIYIFGRSEGENVIIHCRMNRVKLVAVLESSVKYIKIKNTAHQSHSRGCNTQHVFKSGYIIGEFIEFFFIKSKNIIRESYVKVCHFFFLTKCSH